MIQDGIAERRNMMVTSLLFIAYYYGGGKIDGEEIHFPMVNVVFEHQTFLAVMAYVLFAWFIYRYWLEVKGKINIEIRNELINSGKESRIIKTYISLRKSAKVRKSNSNLDGKYFDVNRLVNHNNILKIEINFSEIKNGSRKESGSESIEFYGLLGRVFYFIYYAHNALTQKSFTNYIIPYIVAFFGFFGFALAPAFQFLYIYSKSLFC